MTDANDVRLALDDFLGQFRPGSANGRVWTWEEEEADILARECLCCGARGHYQRQLEAHLADAQVIEGICAGPDGRVWDGHHRITAARRLGIPWVTLESPEENAERWLRDHGPVSWHDRKTGDRHVCTTTWPPVERILTMQRPVEDFQRAAIERGIRVWGVYQCGACGYQCGYVIEGEGVLYDSGCWCSSLGVSDPHGSSWEELAEHYNRNQPDRNDRSEGTLWLAEMRAFWGFDA